MRKKILSSKPWVVRLIPWNLIFVVLAKLLLPKHSIKIDEKNEALGKNGIDIFLGSFHANHVGTLLSN